MILNNYLYLYLTEGCFFLNKALLGHSKSSWVPALKPFASCFFNDFCVFSFIKFSIILKKILNFLFRVFFENRTVSIFFVNGMPFSNLTIKCDSSFQESFKKCLGNYVLRWVPGLFSNSHFVLNDYRQRYGSLQRRFGKTSGLNLYVRIPSVVIFLSSAYYMSWGVLESNRTSIPSIGVVDSNAYFSVLSFPLFANDDSALSMLFYIKLFTESILRGIMNAIFSEYFIFNTLDDEKILGLCFSRKIKKSYKDGFFLRFSGSRPYRCNLKFKRFFWLLNFVFLKSLVCKFLSFKYRSKFMRFFACLNLLCNYNIDYYLIFIYKFFFYLKLSSVGFNFSFFCSYKKYSFLLSLFNSCFNKLKRNVYLLKNILLLKILFFFKGGYKLLNKNSNTIYNNRIVNYSCVWYDSFFLNSIK